jgi:hypothetical protein
MSFPNFRAQEWGPEEYRAYLHEHDDTILDQVMSPGEWSAFKKGMALWLEDVQAEYEQLARDQEHGLEP